MEAPKAMANIKADEIAVPASTILVAEDNEGLLRLISKTFSRIGIQVQGVTTGAEAIDQTLATSPILLLLDFRLPDITADEVVSAIRKAGNQTPFVIMTGHGDEQIAVDLMKLGARDYIIKDKAFIDQLPGVIEQVIDRIRIDEKFAVMEREKERLEGELAEAQKMEAIGTFAGGIAHDFNNILAIIIGYSDMLQEDLAAGSPEAVDAKNIFAAATRAKNLVEKFLICSRQPARSLSLVVVQDVIKKTVEELQKTLPANIRLEQKIDPTCDAIKAVEPQVQQVLMNIWTNSIEAMADTGGVLRIKLTKEEQAEEQAFAAEPQQTTTPYIRLTVSDTGGGMSEATLERIFEPYFTTKETGKGSGLGLAVVYGIVKKHGGMIKVENVSGQGVTFSVFFPVAETLNTV
jgi:signal transduction histidine kinase